MKRRLTPLILASLLVAPLAHAQWPFGESAAKTDDASGAAATPVRVFRLAGKVHDRALPFDFMGGDTIVFPELLQAIHDESQRPAVKALVFEVSGLSLGFAQVGELAAALAEARKAGKKIVVHMDSGDLATLAATATADEVDLVPEGTLFINGLQAEVSFYHELLGTLGLEADIEAVGQYKSAMEPYTRATMSDAARANLDALLDSLFASLVDAVGKPKKLSSDEVRALIDRGLFTAEEAKKAKLVDRLAYWSEVVEAETKASGEASIAWPKASDKASFSSVFDLLKLLGGDDSEPAATKPRIAVLVAEGTIVDGRDPSGLFDSESVVATEDFLDELHTIEHDPSVKAIVLRIDSPGGSALASDIMWRELVRVGKTHPLIVSMGDVAASGGYYIASAGKKIFASPMTLTGSIGVFGGKLVYHGLLDKIGVSTVVIARGKNASLFSGLTRFSDAEREVFRSNMRHTYETFVNKVARGRNMSFEAVDKVAQGRVWSGAEALSVGLVDKLGTLADAVAEAAKQAKLEDYETVTYPKGKSLLGLFDRSRDSKRILAPRLDLSDALPGPLAEKVRGLARVVEGLLGQEQVLAMMPFALTLR